MKTRNTGRDPDIHSLALSITTLFLSVFRAPLHTSFTLFRCVPGCLVKTTVQLIEEKTDAGISLCISRDKARAAHSTSTAFNYSEKESKKAAMHFCGKWPTAGLVYESESLFGLIWSVKGTCFFSYRAQARALEGEHLYTVEIHSKISCWTNFIKLRNFELRN